MKFGFNWPCGFLGKEVWKCWNWVIFDDGQWMTLTFDIHTGSCTHLVDCIYQLWYQRLQKFLKNPLFYLFPIQKHIKDQIWPCRKIGQGHHLNKLGSTRVPDAAYQVSRSSAFWFQRRRFLRFLPYMGMAAILVMWPGPLKHSFVPLSHGVSTCNLASIGLAVSKEKKFNNVESEWLWTKVSEWPWLLI